MMHCSSTDKNPMRGKCPEAESLWCFYKGAIAKGETTGRLEIAVTDAIEKHNLGYVKSLESKEESCLNDSFSLTIAEVQDKRRISQNISTKQKKRKRNATNTDADYSAGAF
ncbi:uncharacterized protein TNCV_3132921 [Trichonephila clavipes]|nr:uncharacterized protein TNCV_3132921 [Trichonephila clavipes]